MARLYANENFPLPAVEALGRLGHDVLTTVAAGKAGQSVPDDEVFAFAVREGRALLTRNRRHLLRLLAEFPNHAGIIVCTFDPDYERQARAIDEQLGRHPSLDNQVVRVNRPAR